MKRIVFRADASAAIGSGHIMRCLGLAEIFAKAGFDVTFAASAESFGLVGALKDSALDRCVLQVAPDDEPAALRRHWPDGVDLVLVDHYGRDIAFDRACRGWARKVIVVDDLADRVHDADVLLDGVNHPDDYRGLVPADCALLCGPRYALIDSRFPAARDRAIARRDRRPVERVLVTFGQIDAPNMTMRALAALRGVGFDGDVDIAIGAAAPHLAEVRGAATGRVRLHVNATNLPALKIAADLAIGAGGVTAWERCCLGLPSVITVIAGNQKTQVAIILNRGAGIGAGEPGEGAEERIASAAGRLIADADLRARMARSAAELIDGHGPMRLVQAAV